MSDPAFGVSPEAAQEDYINAVRVAFTKRWPYEVTAQLWDTIRWAILSVGTPPAPKAHMSDDALAALLYQALDGRDLPPTDEDLRWLAADCARMLRAGGVRLDPPDHGLRTEQAERAMARLLAACEMLLDKDQHDVSDKRPCSTCREMRAGMADVRAALAVLREGPVAAPEGKP